ncbi:hypothetical protein SLE2022_326030 [Rubroshorea leprosula]
MDKSCHSADSCTTTTTTTTSGSSGANTNPTTTTRDNYLNHLNKLSHKISKPTAVPSAKKPTFDSTHLGHTQAQNQNQQVSVQPQPSVQSQSNLPAQQHQPPVYNINKNDFRDVVQKLTGSPAHERVSAPPPPTIQPTKPQSSRLQRFRPPPLVHVSNRPPHLLNCAPPIVNPSSQPNLPIPAPTAPIGNFFQRPLAPLSPLPPFPAVHAAAESPVSAYMRFFHNSISTVDSNPNQFSGFMPLSPLVSPRWNNLAVPRQPLQPPPPQPPQSTSSGAIQSQLPSSPLPLGYFSPRSPYPLFSPSLLFSPNSGQLALPLSPTVPVLSPTWKGL